MFNSYCRIIIRTLWRNKFYSLINIIGLGIGIAAIIWGFQNYRFCFSYDHNLKDKTTIYRAIVRIAGSATVKGVCPFPLAAAAKNDFSTVKETLRWDGQPIDIEVAGGAPFSLEANFTDPNFFDFFNFPLLRGTLRLEDRSTTVITEAAAKKFFGETDPIGKTLVFYSDQPYRKLLQVTGILKNPPANSSIQFEVLTHIDNQLKPDGSPFKKEDWGWMTNAVFLRLSRPTDAAQLNRDLKKYIPLEQAARQDLKLTAIQLVPLSELINQSGELDKDALMQRPRDPAAYGPLVLAIFILLSACLNFANTSVAHSSRRLKEIGVMKVMGSSNRQVMLQQFLECFIIVMIAMGLAMILTLFWLPAWNAMFVQMHITADYFKDPPLLAFLFILLIIVTGMAGGYPALYISRFNATNIFRGTIKFGGSNLFSRILLGLQMVISFITVVAGVAFSRNAAFQNNYNYGYEKATIMGLWLQDESFSAVRDEMNKISGIDQMAGTRDQIGFSYRSFVLEVKGEKKECSYLGVGPNYTELMKLKLVAGRSFYSTGYSESGRSILLNEKGAYAFGWTPSEAIGQQVRVDDITVCTVIGVLKDFTQNTLFDPIQPLAVALMKEEQNSQLILRTKPGALNDVYDQVKATWTKLYPGKPFNGYYQDQVAAEAALANKNIAKTFSCFALISMLITATGLFALVSLTLQKRIKEIAIRRVVGANGRNILLLALKGYYWIFLLSAAIGSYAGYSFSLLLMDRIFRINVGVRPSSLILSLICVILISALTVGARVGFVLRTKPAEVLKAN